MHSLLVIMLFIFCAVKKPHDLCGMNEGMTGEQKRSYARLLYTKEGYSISDVAVATGLDEAQVRQWIQEGDWSGQKSAWLVSGETQLENLYGLLEQVITRMRTSDEVNPKDADLAAKYTAAIRNLDTDTSVTQIIAVAKLFTLWLRRTDLELAKVITLRFDAFIKERLQ